MAQTISVFRAGVGSWFGAVHPALLDHANESLARAAEQHTVLDGQAHAAGDDVLLVLSHDRGEHNEAVHRLAWDVFAVAAEMAKKQGLHAPGRDLAADAFMGTAEGLGPAVAELELVERPSEPLVVLATDAPNLALVRAFADPLTTPALALLPALRAGFAFEVHDVAEHRKLVVTAPEEAYDLLALAADTERYVIKRVVSRATNDVAAVASTPQPPTGLPAAGAVAVVRCHNDFPTVRNVQAAALERTLALGVTVAEGKLGAARILEPLERSAVLPPSSAAALAELDAKLADRWVSI